MRKAVFIFALSLFIFVFSSIPVFAADVTLSGNIVDQKNNPITQGVVVVNDASGKTVVAAVSDPSGFYTLTVPSGTYEISVSPPKGMKGQSMSYPNKLLISSSIMNFSLKTDAIVEAKKPFNTSYLLIASSVLLFILLAVFVYRKEK